MIDDIADEEPFDPADDLLLSYEIGPTGDFILGRGRFGVLTFFIDRSWSVDELLAKYERER